MITERLFIVVKPKLLTLHSFAALWSWFVVARDKTGCAATDKWMTFKTMLELDAHAPRKKKAREWQGQNTIAFKRWATRRTDICSWAKDARRTLHKAVVTSDQRQCCRIWRSLSMAPYLAAAGVADCGCGAHV